MGVSVGNPYACAFDLLRVPPKDRQVMRHNDQQQRPGGTQDADSAAMDAGIVTGATAIDASAVGADAAGTGAAGTFAPLCGLWVEPKSGRVHTARAGADGGRIASVQGGFRPFLWTEAQPADFAASDDPLVASLAGVNWQDAQSSGAGESPAAASSVAAGARGGFGALSDSVASSDAVVPSDSAAGATVQSPVRWRKLHGKGSFGHLADCATPLGLDALVKAAKALPRKPRSEVLKPLEHQYLLQSGEFLFEGLRFDELRRCQLDIETRCADSAHNFPDARREGDRVLAIGLRQGGEAHLLELEADTDAAEAALLERLNATLATLDPDVIEGHNIFKFDLDYLRLRCKRLKVKMLWARFGQEAAFRQSRLRVAERWIDFPRCDLAGRAVFDTFLAAQLYDVSRRELPSYSLKVIARYFGVTTEADNRTYVDGGEIATAFDTDRERFRAYLRDDLRESEGVGAILLPTYAAQVKAISMTLQEAALRGTGGKVDLLLLARYLQAGQALPEPSFVEPFEGALSRSLVEGVYRDVLHFDVASLYPSLLLLINRAPKADSLGAFLPLLEQLRSYRLRYKKLAREATQPELAQEYDARQNSFKILINSFYGYLGFAGARFADGDLAAEVTARGRALMETLVDAFGKEGCKVLEVDTDGLYVAASEADYAQPQALLARLSRYLPAGIELEFDGAFPSMFCYKAKNYALYDGKRVHIAGSALRSRGVEPFLKELNETLIHWLLGVPAATDPVRRISTLEEQISERSLPVAKLARAEYLSQSPQAYTKSLEQGKGMRRASLEVALTLDPPPSMGDRVEYYITTAAKRLPDWQRARALAHYDAAEAPYDTEYYLKKLEDWRTRYAVFLPDLPQPEPQQGELFG